ncbi:MAG: hypothetical protein KDK64_01830 [Chlamydiia bacterium]|nr:hypothetical protein [Chlamydiia bacterium]
MRFLSTLIVLGALGYGAYYLNNTQPELKHKALEMINTGTFHTLEARFTARQIMEKERLNLLKDTEHRYSDPTLRFHPYLLMEVKFTNKDFQTEEGIILWDLIDGEMVLDTRNWDKTHGFADCINAGADRYEYKILTTIAESGGQADRQSLMSTLSMEPHLLEAWLDRARKKKLVVQHGNHYRIHLHDPLVNVRPSTFIADPLVTKSCKHSERLNRRYTPSQIKKAAEAAFGSDFAIRTTRDVFLPIYSITVQNPDGSLHTSHWNALNGKQISHANLIE